MEETEAMAEYSFDLVERPWVPAAFDGGTLAEVGLREVLARAHEIRGIVDPSPLVTAALHRLLLAVLHRVFGPPNVDTWEQLWTAGRLDAARIGAYLSEWRPRFDLFDVKQPFYQAPNLGAEYAGPVSKLAHEQASGNNTTLFDHSYDGHRSRLGAAEAARLLVAHQAFAVGGLVSLEKGQDSSFKSATAAPLAGGAVAMAIGESLFETLLLNLLRYDCAAGAPIPCVGKDAPAWEQPPLTAAVTRLPLGYLDYLTWQSRRVRLFPAPGPEGAVVAGVAIMKGAQLAPESKRWDLETMMAFTEVRKPLPGADPWRTLGFDEARATWRNSTALMHSVNGGTARPRVLAWLGDLAAEGVLDRAAVVPVDLMGLSADKAKVLLWRHERLPLPLSYLDEAHPELVVALRTALEQAEQVDRALRDGVREAIRLSLSPAADHQGGRDADRAAVTAAVDGIAPSRAYWAALEAPFRELLQALPGDASEFDGRPVYGEASLPRWGETLRRVASQAFDAATSRFEGSGRNEKAAARGRLTFERGMAQVFETKGGTDGTRAEVA